MAGGGPAVLAAGKNEANYQGGVTFFVIFTAIVAASGGLLFGYDNGVTGGVTSMEPFLRKFFPSVAARDTPQANQSPYCKFNDQGLQLFTSSLFLAGMIASYPASIVTTKYGRKVSMLTAGIMYLIGVVLVTAAADLAMLIIGRVFLGFGVGFAIQSVTLYNSEMAPAHLRGALNILFQLAVTIGILVAQCINYGTETIDPWGWRLSLGLAGVPAVILTIGGLLLPETPNSLIERNRLEEGRRVLRKIRGTDDIEAEFADIQEASVVANMVQHPWRNLLQRQYRPQLIITILMPFFQQFTGINAIIFYAPQLFNSLGSSRQSSLLSTLIIGAVNVVSTLVAVFGVDKFGRRLLLIEAGIQMFAAEVAIAIVLAIYFGNSNTLPHAVAISVIVLICVFISCFAWSWGPLGWLVPSEIHPLETRSAGQSLNVAVNLLFTFVIGQSFLSMLCTFQYGVFLFFAGWVVVMTLFTIFFIPETKGLLIEDVHEVFAHHWFWKRIGPVVHHKDLEARISANVVRYSVDPATVSMTPGYGPGAQPSLTGVPAVNRANGGDIALAKI